MSEHEKREQIGELVETISHIRDESNHIAEKLNRAFYAYARMTGSSSPHHWAISAGQLDVLVVGNTPPMVENADLSALLNRHELIETLKYQDKLQSELKAAEERLTKLAPHLFS